MSMVYVGLTPQGIAFCGDGVSYDTGTGRLVQYVSKLHLFPAIGCIMGFTGIGHAGVAFAAGADGLYASFDGMLGRVVADLRDLHAGMTIGASLRHPFDARLAVAMGGWSESRRRFEAYRVTSFDKETTDRLTGERGTVPAWELAPIEGGWVSMMPSENAVGRTLADDARDMDVIERGIRYLCAGRLSSGEGRFAEGYHGAVGGFIQAAWLDRNGISTWIAHRWPEDVLGEPLDPGRGSPLPPDLMEQDRVRGQAA